MSTPGNSPSQQQRVLLVIPLDLVHLEDVAKLEDQSKGPMDLCFIQGTENVKLDTFRVIASLPTKGDVFVVRSSEEMGSDISKREGECFLPALPPISHHDGRITSKMSITQAVEHLVSQQETTLVVVTNAMAHLSLLEIADKGVIARGAPPELTEAVHTMKHMYLADLMADRDNESRTAAAWVAQGLKHHGVLKQKPSPPRRRYSSGRPSNPKYMTTAEAPQNDRPPSRSFHTFEKVVL